MVYGVTLAIEWSANDEEIMGVRIPVRGNEAVVLNTTSVLANYATKAGLSLSSARLLVSHGVDVVVLEAVDRVGGRTLTVHPPDDDPSVPKFGWADLGASYVGPSQNHILRLCKELGLGTYLCSDKQDFIHYSKGRQFCYQTTWPNLWWSNPLAYLEVVYMCRLMDNMSKEIPLDKPWKAPRAKEWDKLTVQDFLSRHCWTKDGVEFLLAMCNCNNTADGHEMSLLYYLWYMCQGGGLLNLWSVKGGAQERKIVERVHLNQPVIKINYSTKGVCVQTLDGTEFTGTHLILALPPPLQMKIHFDPPLSSHRYGFLQRSPMGLVLKCIIFFNHPFWAEKGHSLMQPSLPLIMRESRELFSPSSPLLPRVWTLFASWGAPSSASIFIQNLSLGCRVQLSKGKQPELLTNEKIEPPDNNETGIVKPGTNESEDPEFMNVDEGFQLLNASLTLIGELQVVKKMQQFKKVSP
uniref:monoamine oxidase n=1 Tax=Timema shepardi TaxID=629360 RepID=A0A7R9B3G6_TIMSH|nr:unnamed protein product [Timema shepardi]